MGRAPNKVLLRSYTDMEASRRFLIYKSRFTAAMILMLCLQRNIVDAIYLSGFAHICTAIDAFYELTFVGFSGDETQNQISNYNYNKHTACLDNLKYL